LVEQPELRDAPISSIMGAPFPIVKEETSIADISKLISKDSAAVLVELSDGSFQILTRYDIISAMS
jgi:cystathionine beta-synthase